MKRMLARDTKNIKASLAFTGLCVTWTIASALAIAIRGGHRPWETLGNANEVVSTLLSPAFIKVRILIPSVDPLARNRSFRARG